MVEQFCCGSLFTNCYVISNDKKECIVIDPGLSFNRAYNHIISKYKVLAILLTHGHCDHIDGISYLKNIPIYISKQDEPLIYDNYLSLYDPLGFRRSYNFDEIDIHTFNDNEIIKINDFIIKCIITPGHTKGSTIFEINKELFTGDTLFNMSIGRTDFPTGSQADMNSSLKRIINLYPNDIKLYPGHGDETTLDFERKHNSFLSNL